MGGMKNGRADSSAPLLGRSEESPGFISSPERRPDGELQVLGTQTMGKPMRVPCSRRTGGKCLRERLTKKKKKMQGIAKITCPVSASHSRIFQNLELSHPMAVTPPKCETSIFSGLVLRNANLLHLL